MKFADDFRQTFLKLHRERRARALRRNAELEKTIQIKLALFKLRVIKFLKLFVACVCGVMVAALLLEGALRIFGYQVKPLAWERMLQADPSIHVHSERIWTRPEPMANSYNLPSSRVKFPKKILFLGDPVVGEPLDIRQESVSALLAKMLKADHFESLAYGAHISGYGPEQEYSYLESSLLSKLQPDMIVWSLDVDDYNRMQSLPIYLRTNDSLYRLPSIFQGIYLQAHFYNTLIKISPRSHLFNLIAYSLEKVRLGNLFFSRNDYQIAMLISRMVDDLAQQGVPVLVVRAPRFWEISNIDETRNWHFFRDMGRRLPNFIDADEEFYLTVKDSPDTKSKIEKLFEFESALSESGKRAYAKMIFDYIVGHDLLAKS